MAIARVNQSDIDNLYRAIEVQTQNANDMANRMIHSLGNSQMQVSNEIVQVEADYTNCVSSISSLELQISEVEGKINELEAKLQNTPPKIKEVHYDEDGNEYIVWKDNQAFIDLQSQISALSNTLSALRDALAKLRELKIKLQNLEESLRYNLRQLQAAESSIASQQYHLNNIAEDALPKLFRLSAIVDEYRNFRTPTPRTRKNQARPNYASCMASGQERTQSNIVERINEYFSSSSFDIKEKEKYYLDPQWISLNIELKSTIGVPQTAFERLSDYMKAKQYTYDMESIYEDDDWDELNKACIKELKQCKINDYVEWFDTERKKQMENGDEGVTPMSLYFSTNIHSYDRGFLTTKAWAFCKLANQMMEYLIPFTMLKNALKTKEDTVEYIKENIINAQVDLNNDEKSTLISMLEYLIMEKQKDFCNSVKNYLNDIDKSKAYKEGKPNFEFIFDVISKGYDYYLLNNEYESSRFED